MRALDQAPFERRQRHRFVVAPQQVVVIDIQHRVAFRAPSPRRPAPSDRPDQRGSLPSPRCRPSREVGRDPSRHQPYAGLTDGDECGARFQSSSGHCKRRTSRARAAPRSACRVRVRDSDCISTSERNPHGGQTTTRCVRLSVRWVVARGGGLWRRPRPLSGRNVAGGRTTTARYTDQLDSVTSTATGPRPAAEPQHSARIGEPTLKLREVGDPSRAVSRREMQHPSEVGPADAARRVEAVHKHQGGKRHKGQHHHEQSSTRVDPDKGPPDFPSSAVLCHIAFRARTLGPAR